MEFVIFFFLLVYLGLVFVFSHILRNVKQQRTLLYDKLLREHRYWHRCTGGLGIEDGDIKHFAWERGYNANHD